MAHWDWRKVIGWTAASVGCIILLAIVAGLLLLKTSGFQRYVIAKIEQAAGKSTGAKVEIQSFDFHPLNLTADVYGLTVHGNEPADAKPLLQLRKATIGLKIISVIRRKVNLTELLLDEPVVNLVIDRQGKSNLPQPPSKSKSSTNVFDLAVGHVLLTNGTIYTKDLKIPLDANLFDLRTEIHFIQLEKTYSGTISYRDGTIHYKDLRPLPHSLDAKFSASPSVLSLNPLVARIGSSRAMLDLKVRDYSDAPVADGRYDIRLHTQDFSGFSSTTTSGDVKMAGVFGYRTAAGEPALRNIRLNGEISSNGLALVAKQGAVKIQRLSGHYGLANGNFEAEGFSFDVLNGTVNANGKVMHLDATPQSQFHVVLSGISIAALKSAVRKSTRQSVPITGTINAQADAAWTGSFSNLKASSDLRMRGALLTNAHTSYPLNADVLVRYDGPQNLISIPTGNIQLPATTVTAHGQIGGLSGRSNLVVHAVSTNLHQLMLLATDMSATGAPPSNSSALASLQGALTLNGNIQGTLKNPSVAAQLSVTNIQVREGQFRSLQLALNASPSLISIHNGSLQATEHGQLLFTAQAGLTRWSYQPSSPVTASLQIHQMPLAMLDQLVTTSYPITGFLNGNVQIHGSELNPVGQGRLQISKARLKDEPIQTVTLQFTADDGTIRSQASVGTSHATVNFTPKTKAYELALDMPPQEVSKWHIVQAKNLPIKGQLSITARGAGTINDPQLTASIQMNQLQLKNTPVLQLRTDVNVAKHVAHVQLSTSGGAATLAGDATVQLSKGYYTEASFNTNRIPLEPSLAVYYPSRPMGLTGETEIHASIRGPLADESKIEAHLTIPVLRASYQSLNIGNTGPLRLDFVHSEIVLQPVSFKGTDTTLQLQGRIPLRGAENVALTAKGSIGLGLAKMFNPEFQTGGRIVLDVGAGGSVKHPSMHGQIKIVNAAFATESLPLGFQNLNATMNITDTTVQVLNATAQMGGGELEFGGSIAYRPTLQTNLSVKAHSVRVRYPQGVRSVFDGDLTLTGDSQASTVQGRVLINSLSFTSDFDLSNFMGQFTSVSAPVSPEQTFADRVKLQIAVQSSGQLSANTSQLGLEGQANLKVIGTAAEPVVTGRADITSADIFFQKREYHMTQGVINFVNPNKTEPVVNLMITTTINQYNLTIHLQGPIEAMKTSYISDPPLAEIDIINLIARGTTTEGAPTSFGASAVLAKGLSEAESAIGSNISGLTGISGLQIDPMISGNNANPTARIGIQKRVTKNFTFTFSTDVTQPQNEIVQGEYQLNKRWSVSATREQTGGFAVDGRYHTNF
jgi:translocation and assembly module TamB